MLPRANVLRLESSMALLDLLGSGHLDGSTIKGVFAARNQKDVVQAFKEAFAPFDEAKAAKAWHHVINSVWEGVRNADQERTVFNEYDNIFFRELLRAGCVISKRECLQRVFKTEYFCNVAATDLVEMEIVLPLRLKDNGVIYVLDPKFFSEVFG